MDSSIEIVNPGNCPMRRGLSAEKGMTLIECLIAMTILLFGLLSLAQVLAFSVVASKTYGRDDTKTTIFARDKMEELMGLEFSDTTTDVTADAPFPAGGVGLTAGGGIPPAGPSAGYVDYVDHDGNRTGAGNAAYTRQWQIIDDSASLKRIVVNVTSNESFEYGQAPSTTTVTFKTP